MQDILSVFQSTFQYWYLVVAPLFMVPILWVFRKKKGRAISNIPEVGIQGTNHSRIIEGLNDLNIVAITDADGKITYVNEAFERISGYSAQELIGKTHRIIRSNFHSKSFYKEMWDTISTGVMWQGVIKNRAKNGSYYWVNTSIIPILDKDHKIEHYLSIRHDITKEMEHRESKEKNYIDTLKQRNEELEAFAYEASHDLRKPLTTIKGISSLLTDYLYYIDKPDEYKKHISYVHQSADRLLRIVDTLLSQTSYTDHEPHEKRTLKQIIEIVVSDLNIQKRMPELKMHYLEDQYIVGYPTALQRLFQNLVDNSMKYAHPNRSLELNIKIESFSKEGVRFQRIYFTDNGIGMGEDDKKKCFNVFERGKNSALQEGIGIGLASCKKIMDLLHGRIYVESELDRYTTFILEFPEPKTEGSI